ncbi:MAG: hypothetical protein ABR607_06940 [Pyrinomonadaceae bacterium]
MKKQSITILMLLSALMFIPSLARSQGGGAKQGPNVVRDPDMEKDSFHNLEVARQYFKLNKAYVASLQRCEEVLAGNPAFSKIDEVLFIAGSSSLNLAEARGKQKPDKYVIHEGDKKSTLSAAQFREKARDYLSQLVQLYPQSRFKDEALEDLKALGGAKPADSKP